MNFTTNQRNRFIFAYITAIIIYHFSLGLNTVDPTNVNWIMTARHDIGQHYLGWEFFRYDAWTFPLGNMSSYDYPLGANIGNTDSIPLLALLFKPFSNILPAEFQYLGLWLLFCYLMVAHYTLKILELYKIKIACALPVVAIVVGNSCLWFRYIHPALCAHGFILAGLYLYLKPANAANVKSINRAQVLLALSASLIHPYIWAIIIGFNVIIPLKNYLYDKLLTVKQFITYPVIAFVGTLILWFAVGLIGVGGDNSYAAKTPFEMHMNLNVLYNPWIFSSFLPELSRGSEGNYEGYMYLGVGMFIIIFFAVILLIFNRSISHRLFKNKALLPLAVFLFLLTVFAISNKAMIGDTVLYDIQLPEPILFIGKVFRASVRFFWVVYYVILLFFCIVFIRSKFAPKAVLPVLLLLTALQAYDLKQFFTIRSFPSGTYDTPLDDENWKNIMGEYKSVTTYMPFVVHNVNIGDWQDLMYLALQEHKPITLGNTARENVEGITQFRNWISHAIENDVLPKDELYIATPEHLSVFAVQLYNKRLVADYLDGYYLLRAPGSKKQVVYKDPVGMQKRDSVARLYAIKTQLTEFVPQTAEKIKFNLENFTINGSVLMSQGWAFTENANDNRGDSIYFTIKRNNKYYRTPVRMQKRPGMDTTFGRENLEDSGFFATIYADFKPTDSIGIAIKTKAGNWAYMPTGKSGASSGYSGDYIPMLAKLPPVDAEQSGSIDEFFVGEENIELSGWSALKTEDSYDHKIQVVFKNGSHLFAVDADAVPRPDVTGFLKNHNYDNSGFKIKVPKKSLPKGKYTVGVIITNTKTGRQAAKFFEDKTFEK